MVSSLGVSLCGTGHLSKGGQNTQASLLTYKGSDVGECRLSQHRSGPSFSATCLTFPEGCHPPTGCPHRVFRQQKPEQKKGVSADWEEKPSRDFPSEPVGQDGSTSSGPGRKAGQ